MHGSHHLKAWECIHRRPFSLAGFVTTAVLNVKQPSTARTARLKQLEFTLSAHLEKKIVAIDALAAILGIAQGAR